MARWAELLEFGNTFQDKSGLKGNWHKGVFGNLNPIIAELGCGKGEYTVNLAKRYQHQNFIGIDIKGARIWRGAKTAFEENLNHVKFVRTQIDHITEWFNKDELDEIWITFPDPQPGKPHEKKRLTSPKFLKLYTEILKPGGIIHLKTDNSGLYNYTLEVCQVLKLMVLDFQSDIYSLGLMENDNLMIKTTYEKLFASKGETIKYVKFTIDALRA